MLYLLDLTAAFDTVDHAILIRRLETTFGIGTTLNWLSSYLEGRTQSVHLNGQSTDPRRVVFGVPQGSVLGPLLFTLYTADIGKVISKYGLSHHIYADDNQLYGCCLSSDSAALRAVMVRCIASVGEWMESNRLMLNPSKSEVIGFTPPRRIRLIDRSSFVLPNGVVNVSSSVPYLHAFFDEGTSMSYHVNCLVRSCFYHLRRIKFIRRSLTKTATKMLVNSFIISRVDYCNSILAGIPKYQISRVQSILNVEARVIYGQTRFDHVTPTMRDRLHWLRVPERIQFKRCLLVYKAPAYITEYCTSVPSGRRLHSSLQQRLRVPRPSKTVMLGERSFSVGGPSLWINLPDTIKEAETVELFKKNSRHLCSVCLITYANDIFLTL